MMRIFYAFFLTTKVLNAYFEIEVDFNPTYKVNNSQRYFYLRFVL